MKKIYLFICLVTTVFASCKKVLDTKPQGLITDPVFWTAAENLKLFSNNFYTSLYTPDANADNQSDNSVTSSPHSWLFSTATVPSSGGGWDWGNIRNANYFLSHYQTATGEKAEINQYVGEIRFFRANEYFNKVKSFGDVPWINKDLSVGDSAYLYKPRDPQKLVVDSIISDLNFAIANTQLPEKLEVGRIHKYAAMQLLARVSLYQATYMKYRNMPGWEPYMTLAANTAKAIMTSGKYDIVRPAQSIYYKKGDLIDAKTNTIATRDYPLYYKELFIQEDLTGNKECVLPKIYKPGLLLHGLSRDVNENGVGVSKDLIEDFLCVDGLPIAKSPLYRGDDSIRLEITNRDPRLRNMINNRFMPFYLNGTTPVSLYYAVVDNNNKTGYMSHKYRTPIPAQNEANQATYDRFIYRYAEVLLIYAEAIAELGTITQADLDMSINKLRARLDEADFQMGRLTLNPPSDPNAITITGKPRYGYTISPLLYEIRRERRIEMAFEGFRWDDIVRWAAGKLIENPKTIYGIVVNNDVKSQYNDYIGKDVFSGISTVSIQDWDGSKQLVNPYPTTPLRVWNDKLYRNPIPRDQLTLSKGNLQQNPGWQ